VQFASVGRGVRAVATIAFLAMVGVSGCGTSSEAPSATAGPNPTASDPGPNSTVNDPGPNPTTPSAERTVAGRLERHAACSSVVPDSGPTFALLVSAPYGFGSDGLTQARNLVAPYGARIVVSAVAAPTGACGTAVRLTHLVSVLPK
jgi:hypothetical protein